MWREKHVEALGPVAPCALAYGRYSVSASHHMHNALGFTETERVVYFKKTL